MAAWFSDWQIAVVPATSPAPRNGAALSAIFALRLSYMLPNRPIAASFLRSGRSLHQHEAAVGVTLLGTGWPCPAFPPHQGENSPVDPSGVGAASVVCG